MTKTLKKPKYAWYGYNNGIYFIVLDGTKVGPYTKATVVVLADEKTMKGRAFAIKWDNNMPATLDKISELYKVGIKFGENKRVFADAGGLWATSKAMHPLVLKARDTAWEWFKKVVEGVEDDSKIYEFDIKLPKDAVRKTASGITFEGYTSRLLKAHSFATLAKLADDAVKLCHAAWNWKPVDLRILTHPAGSALGLAYNAGKGDHRISLSVRLLNEYDTMSIFRVVLHELCHHYRNETFPLTGNSHDDKFCEALGQVDPVVLEDKQSCQFFTDEVWEGSVVVQAKEALKKSDNYDPTKGGISIRVLADYTLRVDWLPYIKGDGFKRKAMPMNEDTLRMIIGDKDPEVIQVTGGNYKGNLFVSRMTGKEFSTASELIKGMAQFYPSRKYGDLL